MSKLSEILQNESVPDASQVSVQELRSLFRHMSEYYPGTLATAWKEMKEDDTASVETQKRDNRTTQPGSKMQLSTMSEEEEDVVAWDEESDILKLSLASPGASTDDDDSKLRPVLPNHQSTARAPTDEDDEDLRTITPGTRRILEEEDDDDDQPGVPKRSNFRSPVISVAAAAPPVAPTMPLTSTPTAPPKTSDEVGCYLVYDPDSSGKLMLYYSKTAVDNAIGFWTARNGKEIQSFKFNQNQGRSELIGNCASGLAGRKNYYSGCCQFIKAAKALNGSVTLFPLNEGQQALPVDIFVYVNDERPGHQTLQLKDNTPFDVSSLLAVACLPKHTQFYNDLTVNMTKWLTEGSTIGAAISL